MHGFQAYQTLAWHNAAQRVIRAALEASGVSAGDLDLLSMHGTGGANIELAWSLSLFVASLDSHCPCISLTWKATCMWSFSCTKNSIFCASMQSKYECALEPACSTAHSLRAHNKCRYSWDMAQMYACTHLGQLILWGDSVNKLQS